MTGRWPYLPDEELLTAVGERVRGGETVLLRGVGGVGKTSLARAVAARLRRPELWVVGSASTTAVALSSVAYAVPAGLVDPAQVFAALRTRIAETGAVVIVENLEQVDPTTAVMLRRLAATGGLAHGCVSTTREVGDRHAQTILGEVESYRLTPMSAARVGVLLHELTGEEHGVHTIARLHRVTGGNPFHLRQFLDGARTPAEAIADLEDLDSFSSADAVRSRMAELLDGLDPQVTRVIQLLGVLNPLPQAALARAGIDLALIARVAERRPDLVRFTEQMVLLGHEMTGELVAATTGVLTRRATEQTVVDALGDQDALMFRVHRARLAIECDVPLERGRRLEAAGLAFAMGDLALSERLCRAAMVDGHDLFAQMQLVRVLSAQGRTAEADRLLAGLDPRSAGYEGAQAYAITAALHHGIGHGRYGRALTALDHAAEPDGIGDDDEAPTAVRSMVLLSAGASYDALCAARRVTARDAGTVWSALAGYVEAESLRRLGETIRPLALARAATQIAADAGPIVGLGLYRTLVQIHLAGADLHEAETVAAALYELAVLRHLSLAVAGNTLAMVALAEGRLARARSWLRESLDAQSVQDRTGLARGTAGLLAIAAAAQGDRSGAAEAQRLCRRATDVTGPWSETNATVAAAMVLVADGQLMEPARLLREAAQAAFDQSQTAEGIGLLHHAVRLGDRRAAQLLRDRSRLVEGVIPRLQAQHSAAVLTRDGAALTAVAEGFFGYGYRLFAVDAMAAAAVVYAAHGDEPGARRARRTVARWLTDLPDIDTPMVARARAGTHLTVREAEVMTMSARRLSRREIAAALGLSERTVAGYLARVRAKQD